MDLIIVALEDHEMWQQERSQPWLKSAKKWAEERARAPVMAIDPPAGAEKSILPLKVSYTDLQAELKELLGNM